MVDTSNKQFNALINGLFKKDNVKVREAFDAVIKQRIEPILKEKQKEVAKTLFKKQDS